MSAEWRQHQFFVLRALRIGKTKNEIAQALYVSPDAIRMLLHRLRREYGARNDKELIAKFYGEETK